MARQARIFAAGFNRRNHADRDRRLHTQTTAYLAAGLTLIGTLLYLVIAMSANPVLSILTRTDPGHVTFNRAFVNSFLVYVALPGLAFVAAQMPEFGSQLLGWVQPLLSAAATR